MTPHFWLLFSALALSACGGALEEDADGSGGQSGSGGGDSCREGETTFDGCNTCTCSDGQLACTTRYCPDYDCTYDKLVYSAGDTFPSVDGCNTCVCASDGTVACTDEVCTTCEDVSASSADLVAEAKACDPGQADQCTLVVAGALDCGCPTFVNSENEDAIAALAALHEQYSSLMCGPPPCDCASPAGATCAAGKCVDLWDGPQGASCMVNGEVYPSGSSGFPGPLGCNTCSCLDGELGCTKEGCSSACPPDSVSGSQCAQCGPDDACEIVEYACLKVCSDTCETGSCVDGVCRAGCP